MRSLPFLFLLACVDPVDGTPTRGISSFSHPCDGSRTDTLFGDDDGTLWLGCGEAAEGTGLYTSDTRGSTWRPVSGFDDFRVSNVSRGSNGLLYIAGTQVGGDDRVRSLQGATIISEFVATNLLWNTFHVGTFVRQDNGFAIAESLTGSALAMRTNDTAAWADGSPWNNGSYQMLDLVDDRGTLVGVGSTIAQPHTIFVQNSSSDFQSIELDDTFTGELWAIDTHNGRYVAGGVDQDADQAMLYVNDGDPRNADDWSVFRFGSDRPTWIRDVCVDGDTLIAVGEYSQRDQGLLLHSTDGGEAWVELDLPSGAGSLHNCFIGDDIYFSGSGGFLGRL